MVYIWPSHDVSPTKFLNGMTDTQKQKEAQKTMPN